MNIREILKKKMGDICVVCQIFDCNKCRKKQEKPCNIIKAEEEIRKLIPKKKEFNPISIVEKICIKKEREGYNKAIDEVNKKLFGG